MGASKYYLQCHLTRGDSHTTRWIESRGAIVGASVEVLPERELWEVTEVFKGIALREDILKEHQRLNRHSLPSVEPVS